MKLVRLCGSAFLLLLYPDLHGQSVYSVNALGYVDVSLSPGSNFIVHAFNAQDHRVARLFPVMPPGTYFTSWDAGAFTWGPTNFYSNGWSDSIVELRRQEGALLWVTQSVTVSLSGELFQGGAVAQQRSAGFYLLGMIPNAFFFSCSDFNECTHGTPPDQTQLCKWNAAGQACVLYTYFDLGFPEAGWYDSFGNKVEVQLAAGEAGFFWVPQTFFLPAAPAPASPAATYAAGTPRRTETNFTFGFNAPSNAGYAVLRATNLGFATWRSVHEGTTTGTVNSVTVNDTNVPAAFFRVVPPGQFSMFNDTRTPGQFRFQFHAPSNGTYRIERRVTPFDWQSIGTVSGVTRGIASFTDSNAVSARGDYRVRFEP
jgi:hypothetical protein